ncbi:MAG: YkgJ family cysteine cluster protein [Candidatus Diapherotrites archaeon]|nr:YkgJ family cysteine cluster protein [Candidatus Diapherotrites archaeon]
MLDEVVYFLASVLGAFVFYFVIFRSFSLNLTQKFDCTRCGACCKAKVILSKADIKRLESSGMKKSEFLGRTLGFIPRLQVKDGQCKFLTKDSSGQYACSIYEFRPSICRTFPKLFDLPIVDISCGFYRGKWL